jgi:hypothetical protein
LLAGGGASIPEPIPLQGPTSIPEEKLYETFVACTKHAYFEDSVTELGVDPFQLWECALWLQMDEMIALCKAEVARMLVECDDALQSAKTLEGAMFGMLRYYSSDDMLAAACGEMLVCRGVSEKGAELLMR